MSKASDGLPPKAKASKNAATPAKTAIAKPAVEKPAAKPKAPVKPASAAPAVAAAAPAKSVAKPKAAAKPAAGTKAKAEPAPAPTATSKPAATRKASQLPDQDTINKMVEEAAYYLAEKRNFAPGFEEQDWLDAKQQIMDQLQGASRPKA